MDEQHGRVPGIAGAPEGWYPIYTGRTMKTDIHPDYVEAHVRCTCGNEFTTRSTKGDLHVEICSNCHPFYTGKQKLVDTGGRVERFQRRAAKRAARLSRSSAAGIWPTPRSSGRRDPPARRPRRPSATLPSAGRRCSRA